MNHIGKTSALLLGVLAAMLCLLCACRPAESRYIDDVNAGLVSFTDCAGAFTDSLRTISDTRTVPTTQQLDDIETRLNALSKVCGLLETLEAPQSYTDKQAALSLAMEQYRDALERCRVLLNDYRTYDATIRSYPTPDAGSAAMQEKIGQHYGQFVEALRQARQAFQQAQEMFEGN